MQPTLLKIDSPDLNPEECWQAVLARVEYSHAKFVYGVHSTRIFCRPSCPSRRPRRDGVSFFTTIESAIQAGFRACKRCHPIQSHSPQTVRVQKACETLQSNQENPPTLYELSKQVGISPHHLQRVFKDATGVSPKEFSDALRLKNLKTQLQNGETLLNARLNAGYGSSRGLYERAASQLGMTPATYGRGGEGAHIFFGVTLCILGFLLVATTEKGICAITLGDDSHSLEAALRGEFPSAKIERDQKILQSHIESVLRYLDGREPHLDLPLDVRATAFQWRVWQLLKSIRFGETRSYSQVAQMLGSPQAARAVARACATNPVALTIPCHRVVRGDGSLSGYRWGLERKRKLLEREREYSG